MKYYTCSMCSKIVSFFLTWLIGSQMTIERLTHHYNYIKISNLFILKFNFGLSYLKLSRAKREGSVVQSLAASPKDQFPYLAPTWWFTIICNSNLRVSNFLFWPPWTLYTWYIYINTCIHNTPMKIKKNLEKSISIHLPTSFIISIFNYLSSHQLVNT